MVSQDSQIAFNRLTTYGDAIEVKTGHDHIKRQKHANSVKEEGELDDAPFVDWCFFFLALQ